MSGPINDAYPVFSTDVRGMSLRDWFAGQAMAAFISEGDQNGEDTAGIAYIFADAMLEAREEN